MGGQQAETGEAIWSPTSRRTPSGSPGRWTRGEGHTLVSGQGGCCSENCKECHPGGGSGPGPASHCGQLPACVGCFPCFPPLLSLTLHLLADEKLGLGSPALPCIPALGGRGPPPAWPQTLAADPCRGAAGAFRALGRDGAPNTRGRRGGPSLWLEERHSGCGAEPTGVPNPRLHLAEITNAERQVPSSLRLPQL